MKDKALWEAIKSCKLNEKLRILLPHMDEDHHSVMSAINNSLDVKLQNYLNNTNFKFQNFRNRFLCDWLTVIPN